MITRNCKLPKTQSFFLFGPRGTGKSTLLKQHFSSNQKALWINLLDQSIALKLVTRPDSLLELWALKKHEWIIIDEVQKIPQLLDVVHRGIEDFKIKFALTGSSSRKLKKGGANLLAGRAVSRELSTFSSLELADQFELKKCLQFGLLPKVWAENLSPEDCSNYLFSYVGTYLNEEIAAEQIVRKLDPFRRFLVSAAQMNGKILNHSALERDAGIPRKQSERHFEILADTLIGHYLAPYATSLRKRQTSKSKFYFFDTGVTRALQRLAGEDLMDSTHEFGNLFETFLVNEFFKIAKANEKHWEFSYFHDTSEIDLIIEKPRGLPLLIEIKSFKKFEKEKLASFFKIKKEIPHEAAYVLSNDPVEQEVEGVRCLHWRNGLNEIFSINSNSR